MTIRARIVIVVLSAPFLFLVGRFAAACIDDCSEIEAYLSLDSQHCYVVATVPEDENDKPTVTTDCSLRYGHVWVDSTVPNNFVCDNAILRILKFECPPSLCDDQCPEKNPQKEMDFTGDADPNMEGEQIPTTKCRKMYEFERRVCRLPPPVTNGGF